MSDADTTPDGAERGEGREGVDFVLYDTQEQGMALVIEGPVSGFRIAGPDPYGQQKEVARFPVDDRAREQIADRLRETPPEGERIAHGLLARIKAARYDLREALSALNEAAEIGPDARPGTPTPDPPSPCPLCGENEAKRLTTVTLRPCTECADDMDEPNPPEEDDRLVPEACPHCSGLMGHYGDCPHAPAPPVEEGEARAWFRATECNQPPVSVPHSEAAAHGAPICPSCSSVTCMVRTASPPVEEGERGEVREWYCGRCEHSYWTDALLGVAMCPFCGEQDEIALCARSPDARQEERPWAGPPMMHESDCPYSFAHQGEGEPGDAELLLLAEQWCRGDVKGGRSAASQDDLEAAADAIRRLRAPQGEGESDDG